MEQRSWVKMTIHSTRTDENMSPPQLSTFTGSCFACGISLPLCFIIAQVPKQKKTHGTQFFKIDAAGLFFPTVRRALFLVHACPVLTSWQGKDRIMDSLKRFFFSNKKILEFKKGWEKIGLWIPLFVFFSNKKFENRKNNYFVYMNLLNILFFSNKQI